MNLTDPIADLLTRLRNAERAGHDEVTIPLSKVKIAIAEALKREGYIRGFEVSTEGPQGTLKVYLKYGPHGERLINTIRRVSKPGCRVYRGADEIDPVLGGTGVWIVSTSKGVLSDRECRKERVGGEVLCEVW